MIPNVVIIGRTNVGKSTLFNRVFGRRRAIVHDSPGTTRDRNEAIVSWKGTDINLIDTGGWAHDDTIFSASVRKQLEAALDKADLAILLVDAKAGCDPLDVELSRLLRRSGKKTLLVVNKVDSAKDDVKTADFYRLGMDSLIPISANHGRNMFDLLDTILAMTAEVTAMPAENRPEPIRIILVGKPNVGKSSLVNALSHQERSIVHDMPGTTREALDISITSEGQEYLLIDTPGIHRKRKFTNDMEYLSTLSTQHAIERADVAVLVMDVDQGIGETEAKVAEYVLENRKGCLLVVNKWDIVDDREQTVKIVKELIEQKLQFLKWSRVLLVSAKTRQRVDRILQEVKAIYAEFSKIIDPHELRECIRDAETRKPLSRKGDILRIRGVEQTGTRPPSFSIAVNDPELMHFSYRRYLENCLRARFGFEGTPIALRIHRHKALKKD